MPIVCCGSCSSSSSVRPGTAVNRWSFRDHRRPFLYPLVSPASRGFVRWFRLFSMTWVNVFRTGYARSSIGVLQPAPLACRSLFLTAISGLAPCAVLSNNLRNSVVFAARPFGHLRRLSFWTTSFLTRRRLLSFSPPSSRVQSTLSSNHVDLYAHYALPCIIVGSHCYCACGLCNQR
jgi:hypothetical protein